MVAGSCTRTQTGNGRMRSVADRENADTKRYKRIGKNDEVKEIMEKDNEIADSAMLINDKFYIFTSGDSAFVNKWGMKNYGIFKITKKGEIVETLLDSGNLQISDQKKRGVYGVFFSSQKYIILTPVFQSDEWQGKQKLFSMETKELIDIEFPRGFGKYPRVIQHSERYFWVYLWETRHFAICQEK